MPLYRITVQFEVRAEDGSSAEAVLEAALDNMLSSGGDIEMYDVVDGPEEVAGS